MDSLAVVGGVDDDMMAVESDVGEGVRSSRLALTSKSQHFMSVGSLRQDETAAPASDDSAASLCASCGERKKEKKAESMKRTGKRRNQCAHWPGIAPHPGLIFFFFNVIG